VHNLTVADVHAYYVLAGTTPVLVHNCPKRVARGANAVPETPNIVHEGVADIQVNGRPQRVDENGDLDFFTVRPTTPLRIARKWGGAKIYDIPNGGNDYRVLINGHGDIGWIRDHDYTRIYPYTPRS
jgi:hypothetical protein